VATAMAQLMRFHEYANEPNGVGKLPWHTIWVNGIPEQAWMRGSDGLGGPYEWDLMVNEPNWQTTTAQLQAIGALCYDAGVSVGMNYSPTASGAWLIDAAFALRDVNIFNYSNAVCGSNTVTMGDIGGGLNGMVNPNLDYGHPVILDIADAAGDGYAHAVVADGYGYELSTLYHHLNMGKQGNSDAWYNLPNVGKYTMVRGCIYNVFISGLGEIISGRVTDASRNPVSDVNVTAQRTGGGTYVATTNNSGIYALAHVPSASAYTITAAKSGYSFVPAGVNTGTSQDLNSVSGNVWGVDFREVPPFVYVDANATGNNDGMNWYDAFNYLQDGLANVWTDAILVADGIYKPDQGAGITPGDQAATFQLINGVTIYGGYAGVGAPDPNARDIKAYETTLSGDLSGNDVDVNDPCDLLTEPTRAENSYHVVTSSGTEPNAILDGFTITAGNAKGLSTQRCGGGIYNVSGDPTLKNCTFTSNSAIFYGGGMYNESASPMLTNCTFSGNSVFLFGGGVCNLENCSPTLTDCTFSGNSAEYGGGGGMFNGSASPTLVNCAFSGNSARGPEMGGGGMYNVGSPTTVTDCTFIENSAEYAGGGIYNESSNSTIGNCTFNGNSAEYAGGGIYSESSNPTINNCIFSDNSANNYGGGMYRIDCGDLLILTNCIFNNNSATLDGGGIYSTNSYDLHIFNCTLSSNSAGNCGGGILMNSGGGGLAMFNDILWGNTANLDPQFAGNIIIIGFSDVQGGATEYGPENIDADPMFVDANDSHLLPYSPCIDTGYNSEVPPGVTTDLDGRPRFVDGDCNDTVIVDMGAYEFTYAYFGDFDGSCDVDFVDYAILANYWMTDEFLVDIAPTPAGDGIVDERDLAVQCDNWLFGK
jgi:predicted outer membrane repeat protein